MTESEKEFVQPSGVYYSPPQVGEMLQVASRTIMKWYDSGKLKGYTHPASKNRWVDRESILSFCREYDFPIPKQLLGDEPCK